MFGLPRDLSNRLLHRGDLNCTLLLALTVHIGCVLVLLHSTQGWSTLGSSPQSFRPVEAFIYSNNLVSIVQGGKFGLETATHHCWHFPSEHHEEPAHQKKDAGRMVK